MNTFDLLESSKSKLSHATTHIATLKANVHDFFARPIYTTTTEKCEISRKNLLKIKLIEKIPDQISLIAGDVISNLRASLDHLASSLAIANGKTATSVYFPIGNDKNDFLKREQNKFSLPIRDYIRSIEPYEAGKGELIWIINKLEKANKHRNIVRLAHITGKTTTHFTDIRKGGCKFPNTTWDQNNNSLVIAIEDAESDIDFISSIQCSISLSEPKQVSYLPATAVLSDIHNAIAKVIGDCETLIK
jgi:hypothetical protein